MTNTASIIAASLLMPTMASAEPVQVTEFCDHVEIVMEQIEMVHGMRLVGETDEAFIYEDKDGRKWALIADGEEGCLVRTVNK